MTRFIKTAALLVCTPLWTASITSAADSISPNILPTSLAAAGRDKVPEIHDGKNLLPWLMGKADCPNDELFWSWRGQFNAIRRGTLKEIRNGKPIEAIDVTPILLLLTPVRTTQV